MDVKLTVNHVDHDELLCLSYPDLSLHCLQLSPDGDTKHKLDTEHLIHTEGMSWLVCTLGWVKRF